MSPRAPRAGLHDDILEAAERLLLRTGSDDEVSIRAVAEAVGVTAPAIYRHFADKQHLLFEVCSRHFARLADFVADAVRGAGDPVEALDVMARAYVRFGVENPEHYRIMFMGRSDLTPAQYADERILETGAFGGLVTAVQACLDAGRLRPGLGDAVAIAHALWATMHGVTSIAVAKPHLPGPSVEDRIETMLELVHRGLLADGSG